MESEGISGLLNNLSKGKPGSRWTVRATSTAFIPGKIFRIIRDQRGRIWLLKRVKDTKGNLDEGHLDYPIRLTFGHGGEVAKAIHQRPVFDIDSMTDEEKAYGRYLGVI